MIFTFKNCTDWISLMRKAQVDEVSIPNSTIWKRYDGATKGPAVVEVIKNPSQTEIYKTLKQQSYGDEIAVILTRSNVYAFRRDLEFHKNVARKLGLAEYIGVLLGSNYAMVTDATSENFRDNPEVASIVRKMLPQVSEIAYFNEDIVGDWELLKNEENDLNEPI